MTAAPLMRTNAIGTRTDLPHMTEPANAAIAAKDTAVGAPNACSVAMATAMSGVHAAAQATAYRSPERKGGELGRSPRQERRSRAVLGNAW